MTESPVRRSNGLREFFNHLEGQKGLRVLDLGAPSQANVDCITQLGNRIYNEDLYPELYGDRKSANILDTCLNYPEGTFDGVLGWDLMDLLPDPALAQPLAARLGEVTRIGGALLLFFHTAEPSTAVTAYRSQITVPDNIHLFRRGEYPLKRPYNNRNIENLFKGFHSLKFFLAKDGLREVLVVR